jgi:hypothetical protein
MLHAPIKAGVPKPTYLSGKRLGLLAWYGSPNSRKATAKQVPRRALETSIHAGYVPGWAETSTAPQRARGFSRLERGSGMQSPAGPRTALQVHLKSAVICFKEAGEPMYGSWASESALTT